MNSSSHKYPHTKMLRQQMPLRSCVQTIVRRVMMVLPSFTSSSFAPLSSSSLNNNNNNIKKKKTKFEFPIAVGKTLRVMDLCGGKKIVVRNLDPGDERVEISSFLSSLSSLSSSRRNAVSYTHLTLPTILRV